MRVLLHLPHSIAAFSPSRVQVERLRALVPKAEVTVACHDAEFASRLPSADVAVVWRFERQWYEKAPNLSLVATPAAGREYVAPDPQQRCKVVHGSFHGAIMAESLLAMIGFMNRRLGAGQQAQTDRRWARELYADTRPLRDQSVLIVGYGAIGRHMARLLTAVGMRVYGVKRDVSRGTEGLEAAYSVDQMPAALQVADHVVCVLPGDTGTRGMVDAVALAQLKRSAVVYNLGRGDAIDEAALVQALSKGEVAGAFLDVFAEEPLPRSSELWSAPNLYLTPHASAIRADYLDLYFDELAVLLKGHELQ